MSLDKPKVDSVVITRQSKTLSRSGLSVGPLGLALGRSRFGVGRSGLSVGVLVGLAVIAICPLRPVQGQIPEIQYNLLEVATAKTALRTLQRPKRFVWEAQPLREGISTLAKANQLNVWIDRRIDPGQLVTYAPLITSAEIPRDGTLLGRLEQVADEVAARTGIIENVIYVGPPSETERIQAAAVQLHNTISNQDAKLGSEARLLKWPELATPQSLLTEIEKQWGINVQGELPHDLLHAGELVTPSTLATQLSIVVGGFDMQVEMVGKREFRLAKLGSETKWRANYAKASLNPSAYGELRRKYRGSQIQCRANSCSLVGVTSFHLDMFVAQRGPRGDNTASTRRWGLVIDPAPTKLILEKVAAGIGVALEWDAACTDAQRTKLQTLNLDQVTTDELLTLVCSEAGLDYALDEEVLLVRPQSR